MKPVSTATRGLLFALTLLLSTLLVAPTATAKVSYRGFVEAGAGVTTVAEEGATFGYALSTTHGIQYKNNFFGFGAALTPLYCATDEDPIVIPLSRGITKIQLPIYVSWRYDFFGKSISTWAPFVGLKAGFNFIESRENLDNLYYYEHGDYNPKISFGGFKPYFTVNGGWRKHFSSTSGLSLGLALQLSGAGKYNPRSHYGINWETGYDTSRVEVQSYTNDVMNLSILATVAFDF